MTTNSLRNIRILLCLFFCFRMTPFIYAGEFLFTTINASQGLSDNQIRYILQLPDGRMVFTTSGNVNLYDGVHFSYLHRTTEYVYPLNQYNGHYRIYQSGDSLLWIKDTHKLMCIDLYREEYIPDLDAYFKNREIQAPVEDLFVDDSGHIWLLIANELLELNNKTRITLPGKYSGKLQDLNADSTSLYLFYDKSKKGVVGNTGRNMPTTPKPNDKKANALHRTFIREHHVLHHSVISIWLPSGPNIQLS